MPLPFSFSTQRQRFDGESSDMSGDTAASEMIMKQAPGHISTEPLLGTPGNTFSPPDFNDAAAQQGLVAGFLPPAASPNQRPTADAELPRHPVLVADPLQLPSPPVQAPSCPVNAQLQDWSGQIEQLRSDIFSIAMSVSAMNDRIDRIDRIDPRGVQVAGLASLRIEIETWLENHLNAAVEHCMHRIMSRTAPPDAASSNGPSHIFA
jgi:hypothetical protein